MASRRSLNEAASTQEEELELDDLEHELATELTADFALLTTSSMRLTAADGASSSGAPPTDVSESEGPGSPRSSLGQRSEPSRQQSTNLESLEAAGTAAEPEPEPSLYDQLGGGTAAKVRGAVQWVVCADAVDRHAWRLYDVVIST